MNGWGRVKNKDGSLVYDIHPPPHNIYFGVSGRLSFHCPQHRLGIGSLQAFKVRCTPYVTMENMVYRREIVARKFCSLLSGLKILLVYYVLKWSRTRLLHQKTILPKEIHQGVLQPRLLLRLFFLSLLAYVASVLVVSQLGTWSLLT